MEFKGFPAIFDPVIRGHFRALFVVCFAGLLAACKENLSPPSNHGQGPDNSGPEVRLTPGADTLVDSVGTLFVRVRANDRSGIKRIEFAVTPSTFTFDPIIWADTTFDGLFAVPLNVYRQSTFSFSATAIDILDHRTDTPGVTVTVR